MSGAAAVSAAKNRRSRESVVKDGKQFQSQQAQSQQQQQQQQKNQQFTERVELTPIQALHQHDFRLRRSEEVLKQLISTTEELKNGAMTSSVSSTDSTKFSDLQETVDLFNERIVSIEKYIDEELAQSLNLKEKEDKDGEDAIYTKMNSLESLLKELKTELVRIQSSSRDTSMSFLKYKSETDTQIKELKETIKKLAETVVDVNTLATKAHALGETHAQIFIEALQPSTLSSDNGSDEVEVNVAELTVNGC
jgi:hypothetical protein